MRVSALASLLFSASSVVADGIIGFSLGIKNPDGSCKNQAAYEADLATLKSTSTLIRVYAAGDCNATEHLMPAIKNYGFKVVLGIW
jgi:glucan 1,3-beta-glucosidase